MGQYSAERNSLSKRLSMNRGTLLIATLATSQDKINEENYAVTKEEQQ